MLSAIKWLMSVVLLLSNAGQAKAGQILINPGFESGSLVPWYAKSCGPVVTNAQSHAGTFSMFAMTSDEIRQDFWPISSSDITELSFWVQLRGGAFDLVEFFYLDGSSGNSSVQGFTDNWTFFDVTSHLDAGKSLSGIGVYGSGAGAYLDDF